jgi:hypothetical protein
MAYIAIDGLEVVLSADGVELMNPSEEKGASGGCSKIKVV